MSSRPSSFKLQVCCCRRFSSLPCIVVGCPWVCREGISFEAKKNSPCASLLPTRTNSALDYCNVWARCCLGWPRNTRRIGRQFFGRLPTQSRFFPIVMIHPMAVLFLDERWATGAGDSLKSRSCSPSMAFTSKDHPFHCHPQDFVRQFRCCFLANVLFILWIDEYMIIRGKQGLK